VCCDVTARFSECFLNVYRVSDVQFSGSSHMIFLSLDLKDFIKIPNHKVLRVWNNMRVSN